MELESRSEEKMWAVRHLERVRRAALDDLRAAKALCHNVVSCEIVVNWLGWLGEGFHNVNWMHPPTNRTLRS